MGPLQRQLFTAENPSYYATPVILPSASDARPLRTTNSHTEGVLENSDARESIPGDLSTTLFGMWQDPRSRRPRDLLTSRCSPRG